MSDLETYWREKDVAECGGFRCIRCGWGRDDPELDLCCDCFDEEWTKPGLIECPRCGEADERSIGLKQSDDTGR